MEINVFDFDKTIYDGDSSIDFYLFCLKRNPGMIKYAPGLLIAAARYLINQGGKTVFKQEAFKFLKTIKNTDQYVEEFWSVYGDKIKTWYLERDHASDVVISASPDFLLRPVCRKLGVMLLIASKVDSRTGRFEGENCYGAEKLRRLNSELSDYTIREFYSDSRSDQPLAEIASTSFHVRGSRIIAW